MDLGLTADLGNSRLKLCAWELQRKAIATRAVFDAVDGVGRAAAEFVRTLGPLRGAALSSVASAQREAEVVEALRGTSAHFLLSPDCGLAIDVREPALVGRDRLYAARGALAHRRSQTTGIIVVDAGTALTVDALDARTDGRFLGGAIAPGPTLLARALAQHTARLPLIEPDPCAPALGQDTESAVRAGVVVGFRGAALELARRIADAADFRAPLVVMTGGADHLLRGLFELPQFEQVIEDPDLVHRGLIASMLAVLKR